ncbi:MAG TPA: FHA domain-containing protein, partial [Casimicrobiaceae bacterium]
MAIKGWVVHKVNRLFTRVDLPPRATPLGQAVMRAKREPELRGAGSHDSLPRPQHLGAYAPLVLAIREELEQFVASHVRMHLAIAEHDRYLLTSIEVECEGDAERDLLRRFMREFKPRQIKTYIEKEVIGRLPNASAIDLAHFGGLNTAPVEGEGAPDEAYGELLAELRSSDPRPNAQPYQVSLKGRWSELDLAQGGAKDKGTGAAVARTPLAGRTLEVEIEDADGRRHVTLNAVIPGRRYAVGNGEGSDIVVNGKYASRRHCELWFDKGAWWVTDSGSTNGLRVESATSVLGRSGGNDDKPGGQTVIEVVPESRVILSGVARGEAAHYPRLLLKTAGDLGAPATPLAPRFVAPTTPTT